MDIQPVQLLYSISLLQPRVVAKEKRNCWSDLGIKTNNSFRLCNRDMLLCGKSACFAYLILNNTYIVLSPSALIWDTAYPTGKNVIKQFHFYFFFIKVYLHCTDKYIKNFFITPCSEILTSKQKVMMQIIW